MGKIKNIDMGFSNVEASQVMNSTIGDD